MPFSIRIQIASFPGVTRRNWRAMILNHAVQMKCLDAKDAKGQDLSQIHTVIEGSPLTKRKLAKVLFEPDTGGIVARCLYPLRRSD